MEAKELMKGDWVQGFIPNTYSWIYGILNDERVAIIASDTKAYIELSVDDIRPIPLTPDILEKNGFIPAKKFRTHHFEQGDIYISVSQWGRITISSNGAKSGNRMNIDCHYLHQLQHALSLCGIHKPIIP